jgi:hypothetical protein
MLVSSVACISATRSILVLHCLSVQSILSHFFFFFCDDATLIGRVRRSLVQTIATITGFWGLPACYPRCVLLSIDTVAVCILSYCSCCKYFGALVERGSLIQHPKSIHPGSTSNSGSMIGIGPGSSRKAIGPGSFRTFRPGSWHEPGPKEATSFGPGSWHKPGSKGPSLVPVHTTNRD